MSFTLFAWPKDRNKKENPYNFLLYSGFSDTVVIREFDNRRFITDGADILHIHWPDLVLRDKRKWRLHWRFKRLLHAIKKFRSRGGKLVWTAHNLEPHGSYYPDLAHQYMSAFTKQLDGIITLSAASYDSLVDRYPHIAAISHAVIPHMHYRGSYPEGDKASARKQLNLTEDATVLGVFGKIRAHKGIDRLLTILQEQSSEDIKLLIAGNPGKDGLSDKTQALITTNNNVIPLLQHVDDNEVGTIFAACNGLILPYEKILNSGSALLALSFNTPIIAPDTGSLPELANAVGENWAHLYSAPLDAQKLETAIHWLQNRNTTESLDLSTLSPHVIGQKTEAFFLSILHNKQND